MPLCSQYLLIVLLFQGNGGRSGEGGGRGKKDVRGGRREERGGINLDTKWSYQCKRYKELCGKRKIELFSSSMCVHSMNVINTIMPIPTAIATISSRDCQTRVFSNNSGMTATVAM